MKVIPGCWVVAIALFWTDFVHATSCNSPEEVIWQQEAIFTFIPMEAAVDAWNGVTVMRGDVYQVWKGDLQAREQLVVTFPRMLSLGDSWLIASSRDVEGRFLVGDCGIVMSPDKKKVWMQRTLGEPEAEYLPELFDPTKQKPRSP